MDYSLIPERHAPVVKSDVTDIGVTIGLFVGTAGDVVVKDKLGNLATYKAGAGGYLIGKFTRVMASTTAADIVALYAS
jgi:hypothetical protein